MIYCWKCGKDTSRRRDFIKIVIKTEYFGKLKFAAECATCTFCGTRSMDKELVDKFLLQLERV